MTRPIAFITGASSGIGAATATLLAHEGYDLVLVARREDRLSALANEFAGIGATSEIVAADLSDRQGLQRAVERAGAGDVDLLVSNAGVSAYGPFSEIDPHDLERAWTLNADATPALTRAVLPSMLDRGHGGVITVASNLAFSAGVSAPPEGVGRTLPKRALYVGAKAGTVAFTRVLATELAGTGVHATVVCPGLVSSEWNGGASQLPNAMTPQDVARAAWAAFSHGEILCLPGLEAIDPLDQLASAERLIMSGNLGADLATRYQA
ncbi:short-subunit dehydrogenase [Microbacterium natoriense]|uniref:Short-subunit dehydrogenase n=1 Tax=Microbacterium natoriense TaxID=284570 RepID=A0AAW8EUT7_9MICO|nr:SDR family NAD(P)-dependent oxidoreductase [Microbacterium natoriense]MDQ0647061.1 short-subunit dehydrogenase [Microbacterium natoriense]